MKFSKTLLIFAAAMLGAMMMIGCTPAANTTNTANTANRANTANTTTTTNVNTAMNTNAASNSDTASSAANTGVAECDEYIEKYEACLTLIASKAPQAQGALKTSFEAQRKAFTDAAATPAGKSTLPATCKQAMETAKAATTAYACEW